MLTQKKAERMTRKAIKGRTKDWVKEVEREIQSAIRIYEYETTKIVPDDICNWVAEEFRKRGFKVRVYAHITLSERTQLLFDWSPEDIAEGDVDNDKC